MTVQLDNVTENKNIMTVEKRNDIVGKSAIGAAGLAFLIVMALAMVIDGQKGRFYGGIAVVVLFLYAIMALGLTKQL